MLLEDSELFEGPSRTFSQIIHAETKGHSPFDNIEQVGRKSSEEVKKEENGHI